MPNIALSVPLLRRRIETKAFAYGVSSTVATLLSEYIVELLRQSDRDLNIERS
jgi:hypothetical protein